MNRSRLAIVFSIVLVWGVGQPLAAFPSCHLMVPPCDLLHNLLGTAVHTCQDKAALYGGFAVFCILALALFKPCKRFCDRIDYHERMARGRV